MQRIGIRELRQTVGRYVLRVKAGEASALTERGADVVVLAPGCRHDDEVSFLVTELRATPAVMRPEDLPAPPRAVGLPSGQVIEELRSGHD